MNLSPPGHPSNGWPFSSRSLGIYLHIPFCESKCDYCDFASGVYPEALIEPYLNALHAEISGLEKVFRELGVSSDPRSDCVVDTIYIGGGTPSMIDARHVTQLIDLIRREFACVSVPEVTLEVNPGTVDSCKIGEYQRSGVNRISIGMQAFQDHMLRRIGRSHTVQDSVDTYHSFRNLGIKNISIDLIAGLPGQSESEWRENLNRISGLAPEHVSLYMLEVHENTRFGKIYRPQSGAVVADQRCALPDDETVVGFYESAAEHLQHLGYGHYEISNFALPGFESRHNLKYWIDEPFLGFGCGAYSYYHGVRWGNERSVGRYGHLMAERGHAIDSVSRLTPAEMQEERIFLGLRLTNGIDLREFQMRFGFDLCTRFHETIDYLAEGRLVEASAEHLRLTSKGRLLANEVFTEFLR